MKVTFAKCKCSHGVILCAYAGTRTNCVASFIPLYGQFCLYDEQFSYLQKIMRSVHFDHQFDEIKRWDEMRNFKLCRN